MLIFKNYKTGDLDSSRAIKLYQRAFPKEERMPLEFIFNQVNKGSFSFNIIYDDEEFMGFTILNENEQTSYLIFFAIYAKYRNKGYGSKVIKKYLDDCKDKTLIICLETLDKNADNYDIRLRRHNFYKRNGLTYFPNIHISEIGVQYDVMANKDFEPIEYMNLFTRDTPKEILEELGIKCWKD